MPLTSRRGNVYPDNVKGKSPEELLNMGYSYVQMDEIIHIPGQLKAGQQPKTSYHSKYYPTSPQKHRGMHFKASMKRRIKRVIIAVIVAYGIMAAIGAVNAVSTIENMQSTNTESRQIPEIDFWYAWPRLLINPGQAWYFFAKSFATNG